MNSSTMTSQADMEAARAKSNAQLSAITDEQIATLQASGKKQSAAAQAKRAQSMAALPRLPVPKSSKVPLTYEDYWDAATLPAPDKAPALPGNT